MVGNTHIGRGSVVTFTALAMGLAYADRINLAVASIAMRAEFGWTQSTKGLVLAAFFIGLMLFQVISALLALRYGGKRVLSIAVAWWSTVTLLTPIAATSGIGALVAARVALGIGESAVLPASYDLFSRWIPPGERGRAIGRFLCGIPLGQILGFAAAGYLTAHWGWPTSFYLFGILGIVWVIGFISRVRNSPKESDRGATHKNSGSKIVSGSPSPIPWRMLFRSPIVIGFVCANFCHNWALFVLISWLPSYFSEQLGLPIAHAAIYSSLPWLANMIALLVGGAAGDALIQSGGAALAVRRAFALLGLAATAGCLLLLIRVSEPAQALLIICAATFCLGLAAAGFTSVPLDVWPNHAPVLVAVSNSVATIPGIAGVALAGWLLDVTHSYRAVFLASAAISTVGALALAVVALPRGGALPTNGASAS